MNNWCLCDDEWTNFDHLLRIWVEKRRTGYLIRASDIDGDRLDLFDKSFKTQEDAQEFLNSYMFGTPMG